MIAWLLALAVSAGAVERGPRQVIIPPAPLAASPLAAGSTPALPQPTQLMLPFVQAIQAMPAPAAAVTPREMMSHFSANWSLGKDWKAPETSDPEAQHLALTLAQAAASANEAHRRSIESLTMAVDGMAHDVRNTISAAPMALGMLERAPSPKALEILRRSHSNAKRTIDTYVQLARADSGTLAVDRRPLVAAELLETAARDAGPIAAHKKITVEVKADPELKVLGDGSTLGVVAANLLGNAIKYTKEGGRVTLSAAPELDKPGMIRISVKDTGIGISAEDQPKVFSGHRTESGKKQAAGTGFGLQLVRKLVEANGSAIELSSAAGAGSTFSFLLPQP